MEATDWEELSFLLESAGIPVDKAMGFGEGKFEEGKELKVGYK